MSRGRRIGRFEMLRHLGRGAMGDVELARDPQRGHEVALKWMRVESADPEALAAERHGAELQRRVAEEVPAVAGVYEYGDLHDETLGDLFYVAMEYVDGVDLVQVLRAQSWQPLGVARAVDLAVQVTSILDGLHGFETRIADKQIATILHGDIKPENLRLQTDVEGGTATSEQVRLLDFGVAKHLTLTRQATRNLFGSYPYTPPERLRSGMVDERSDLWAIGIILFQMLSGRLPYDGTTAEELEVQVRREPAHRLAACVEGVPDELCALVDRCLAFEADARFATASDLLEQLRAVQGACDLTGAAAVPVAGALDTGVVDGASADFDAATRRTAEGARDPNDADTGLAPDATRRTAPTPPTPPIAGLSGTATRRTEPVSSESAIDTAPETGGTRRTFAIVPPPPPPRPAQTADLPSRTPAVAATPGRPGLGRMRRRLRRAPRWAWIVGGVFLMLQYSAHNAARSVVEEVTTEASPDLDSALSAYRFAARMRPFDFGLGNARRDLREALVVDGDQVIASFRHETTTPRQRDWQRARTRLEAALDLGHRDIATRAKLSYCQAQDDRIRARSLWNDGDRDEARRLWDRSIFGFERAAELAPEWPDPFLGLARIYAYEVFDLEKLEQALRDALGRGYRWADRERAQLADAHRTEAQREITAAEDLRGERRESELLLDARRHLELSIAMYEQILDFGNARQNRDLANTQLRDLRGRLRELRRI